MVKKALGTPLHPHDLVRHHDFSKPWNEAIRTDSGTLGLGPAEGRHRLASLRQHAAGQLPRGAQYAIPSHYDLLQALA